MRSQWTATAHPGLRAPDPPVAACDVYVKPRSRVERVSVGVDGVVTVAVNAVPAEGEANRGVVRLLAECLGIARSRITVVRGTASRRKVVTVEGMEREEIVRRIGAEARGERQ